MHNPLDQLAKRVGKEALDASGLTTIQREISRDAQHADLLHEPDPTRGAERARLGLLGRLASVLCLIEVYGHAPDGAELRACLTKHFAYWEERERKMRAQNKTRARNRKHRGKRLPSELPALEVKPFLWLIAAAVSAPMMRKLKLEPAAGWPPGVYFFGDDLLRVGIVVASELPRDRSTLLVRLMAAGPLLPQAIAELAALPADAHERAVAEGIVVNLERVLGKKASRTPEEEEFIVKVQGTWKQAQEMGHSAGRAEGRNEGRNEGRAEGEARALLTVLRVRGIAVPDAVRERILAQTDLERLERWLAKAIVAVSVGDVIDAPS
jgi:hypothetical protein